MKSFVITIMDNEKSVKAADRCIASAKKYGLEVEKFQAITPADDPVAIAESKKISLKLFKEPYSRFYNCVSAFLSHYSLWEQCLKDNERYIIFEHDAIVTNNINTSVNSRGCINIGKPSYGGYRNPGILGVGPLRSKAYFPGAHAYILEPFAARFLIERARLFAKPTDLFLSLESFPFLQEMYPWPAEAKDSFSTIQKKLGCLSKHNYGEEYVIEDV